MPALRLHAKLGFAFAFVGITLAGCATTETYTSSGFRPGPLPEGNAISPEVLHPPHPEEEEEYTVQAVYRPDASPNEYNYAALPYEYEPGLWPVEQAGREVLSNYGHRSSGMHKGIDIRGPFGSPVYATADGVVTYSGGMSGYGKIIMIKHEGGVETRYAHLNTCDLQVGQQVARGEVIGTLGQSGNASTPHVHYEVRYQGKAIDPFIHLPAE